MKWIKKKILFLWLFVEGLFSRHLKYIISGFVAGFLIFFIFSSVSPLLTGLFNAKENTIAVVGTYNFSNLPIPIERLISVGLTDISESSEAIPALAKSWDILDAGKTYVFHLRNDIYWHDKSRFSAFDVKYNLKDAKITTPNKETLKIELKDSFAPLPILFSKPLFKKNYLGVGLYKVDKFKFRGDNLSFLSLTPLVPGLKRIIYKFYLSYDDAKLAFKMGEVNTLEDWPTREELSGWKNISIEERTSYDRLFAVYFNTQDSLLKTKEVRQALNFAIPSFPGFDKAFTPMSPLSWAYYNKVRLYKYDPDNAKKMLKNAGISTSSAELKLTTFPVYLSVAEKIAGAWKEAGLKVSLRIANYKPADYQAILLSQDLPPDPDQYFLWQSTQDTTNLSFYSNQKIDKLLEDGRRNIDKDKRLKIYADFQRYLVDDAPLALLYYPKVYRITRK